MSSLCLEIVVLLASSLSLVLELSIKDSLNDIPQGCVQTNVTQADYKSVTDYGLSRDNHPLSITIHGMNETNLFIWYQSGNSYDRHGSFNRSSLSFSFMPELWSCSNFNGWRTPLKA